MKYQHVETYRELIHKEDLPGLLVTADAFYNEETPTFEAEYRVKTKSEQWKWVYLTGERWSSAIMDEP